MQLTTRAWLATLLLGAVLPLSVPPSACASTGAHAALVVDAGDEADTYRLCVRLPDSSVSGIELIELAGQQHGLTYELGNGGQSVCMLAGVGSSSGNECFGEYPDFWGYWREEGGSWQWSGTGAGSTVVGAGDVEGWSWGRGQDGSTHPAPPPTRFDDVCTVPDDGNEARATERTRPARTDAGSGEPAPGSQPVKEIGAEAPREGRARGDGAGTERPMGQTRRDVGRSRSSRVPSAAAPGDGAVSGDVLPARASEPRSEEGMPVGAIAAAALGAVLVYAGIRATRRRKA